MVRTQHIVIVTAIASVTVIVIVIVIASGAKQSSRMLQDWIASLLLAMTGE